MALVKLEINGKRIIAVDSRTILEVARESGIDSIPTLCHDEQLEPFASCFLCVVKVQGRPHPAARLLHQGDGGHGGRDRQPRGARSRARRRSSCCSPTTTPTAWGRASSPARRASTSRGTSLWRRWASSTTPSG